MVKNNIYSETVKLLGLTVKKVSLYSRNHPIVTASMNQLFQHLQQILSEISQVTISTKGEEIFFNDTSLLRKELGTQELIEKLKQFRIDSISFSPGLELKELEHLILVLSSGKKIDENQQQLKDNFFSKGFAHIRANLIRYEKVTEGQRVVAKDAILEAESFIKKEAQEPDKPGEIILSDFLSGKVLDLPLEKYQQDILSKFINNPASFAQPILQAAVSRGNLGEILDKFKEFILDALTNELCAKKRKPERLVSSFEKSIASGLTEPQIAEKLKIKKDELTEIFSKFNDELKLHMLIKYFQDSRPNNDKFIERSSKLLTDNEELNRLKDKLKQALLDGGLTDVDSDALLGQIDNTLVKEEKITISKIEYEHLKNKAEIFDKTLLERVKQVTLELEKKTKRLGDEKERVDTVIRNLAEGLIVVDKDGKVVMINPAAEQLLGISKENKIGKHILEDISSHQLVALTRGNLADEGGQVSKEIELKSKDEKTQKILRASTAVVENEDGNTVGMVMVLSDITRQKQVEKMKSDFFSHMSHELRTPIIAAQKSISLLLTQTAGNINDDQNKFLGIANSNLVRLSRLIDNILDMSKIEAGKLKINSIKFDIAELIRDITNSLSSWATDKHIQLVADVPGKAIEIEADKERISQVLTNFIGNALKFTPQEGKITVSGKELVKDDIESIQVSVTDSGIGIEKNDLERIFNKFEQVSLSSPIGVSGTGLGLYICKEIIQLHNGKVWAESEVGKGSAFSFIIPKKFVNEATT
ncbi:MAG: ATP-binding protein [Candidatus Omnitrophota bacterium]